MVSYKVQMPFPGRCVSAGTLVLNHGVTNVELINKDKSLLTSKRRQHFLTHKRFWNEHKLGYAIHICWKVAYTDPRKFCGRQTEQVGYMNMNLEHGICMQFSPP
jgi:hypothetical protein